MACTFIRNGDEGFWILGKQTALMLDGGAERGSLFVALSVCPTGCARCRTPVGVQHAKKKPVLSYELFLKYGGEAGIRTPDTLPYTHFPGVLLQPLGHLTILSSLCCWDER